jgi:hypothetical protein
MITNSLAFSLFVLSFWLGCICQKMHFGNQTRANVFWNNELKVAQRRVYCCQLIQGILVTAIAYELISSAIFSFYRPVVHDWIKCDTNIQPTAQLIQSLINRNEPYVCSTEQQAISQPCVCCVRDLKCFTDVTVVRNTSEMATLVDRIKSSAQPMSRHLPQGMHVLFIEASDGSVNMTTLKSTPHDIIGPNRRGIIGDLLRARELLLGWTPQGSPPETNVV